MYRLGGVSLSVDCNLRAISNLSNRKPIVKLDNTVKKNEI